MSKSTYRLIQINILVLMVIACLTLPFPYYAIMMFMLLVIGTGFTVYQQLSLQSAKKQREMASIEAARRLTLAAKAKEQGRSPVAHIDAELSERLGDS